MSFILISSYFLFIYLFIYYYYYYSGYFDYYTLVFEEQMAEDLTKRASSHKWFVERDNSTNLAISLKIDNVLHHSRSEFQDILIFLK